MIDKTIHKYDFKFESLLTNQCNFNCTFCLNDFQNKDLKLYLDFKVFYAYLNEYVLLSETYGFEPQVYLSGGEPTIHSEFLKFVKVKEEFPDIKLILCTNCTFPDEYDTFINDNVDEIHASIYPWNQNLVFKKINAINNIKLQCVHTIKNNYVTRDFINKLKNKINNPIKVFPNFFEKENYNEYNDLQKYCDTAYGINNISFRFVGKQENRGPGCSNCDKKCITLKAAWLFPNNKLSPCPQFKQELSLLDCYNCHTVKK